MLSQKVFLMSKWRYKYALEKEEPQLCFRINWGVAKW